MDQKYTMILTDAGRALEASALAGGPPVKLTHIAVGDGGEPVSNTQTTLRSETWRGPINRLEVDPDNPCWMVAELHLPPVVGGFYIREVGVFAEDGTLFAVGNHPETYKAKVTDGTAQDLVLELIFAVTNATSVTLVIDPSKTLATRQYVDRRIETHTHAPGQIEGLDEALAAKADKSHSHSVADIDFGGADNPVVKETLKQLASAIRVPRWLEGHRDFHVSAARGNDATAVAGEGRADTPFKTIQAALNYVAENYNLSTYNATVRVEAGEYVQGLVFPKYSATTGRLLIAGAGKDNTILRGRNWNPFGAMVQLFDLTLSGTDERPEFGHAYTFLHVGSGAIECHRIRFDATTPRDFPVIPVAAFGGEAFLYDDIEAEGTVYTFLSVSNGGVVHIVGNVQLSGTASGETVAAGGAGLVAVYNLPTTAITGSATGRRYVAATNGIINTNGRGPEFFPGSEPGVVSSGGQYV